MSAQLSGWLAQAMAQVLATDAPALPSAVAMQIGLHLGWSVVLAWLGMAALGRWWSGVSPRPQRQRQWQWQWQWGVALLLALWAWVPGPYSMAYWLGLVFQTPSAVTVLLCAGWLWERPRTARAVGVDGVLEAPRGQACAARPVLALAALGVLLGWALLLDSLALLPLQLYAWGFSPAASAGLLLAALLPWVLAGRSSQSGGWRLWVVPVAVLVHALWRLPTGNVFDAVLDPLLWLVLQAWLLRQTVRR